MSITSAQKILVLGGTGHLGSNLVHHLVQDLNIKPEKIRVFYLRGSPTNAINDLNGLDLFPGDILIYEDVKKACENVDFVFHMVGNTTFDPRKKKIQWRINVKGTENVLNAYKNSQSIKRLCYTSTVNTLSVPNPLGSIGNIKNCDPYSSSLKLHSFSSSEAALNYIKIVDKANEKSNERTGNKENWEKKINIGYFDSKLAAQELVNHYISEFGLNIVSVLPGTMFGPYDYLIGNGMYLISIYNGKMPGVLPGGLPLAHVKDVVEGHILVMEKAESGSRYIITGREDDNLYMNEMVKIIGSVIKEKNPGKNVKIPSRVFGNHLAQIAAFFSELYSNITHRPNLLSRSAVLAGSLPLFYTYKKAEKDLGYLPKKNV